MFSYKSLWIAGGILAVLFLSSYWPGTPPISSTGIQTYAHMQDQTTQTDSLLTDYIVVEYV